MDFITPYPFYLVDKKKRVEFGDLIISHRYKFDVPTVGRYIVDVDQYPDNIHAIKFHLKSHSNSDDKYTLLVGKNKGIRVIANCFHIIKHIHDGNPFASFVYVGAPLKTEEEKETKRFKIYTKINNDILGPARFIHHQNKEKSHHLMISRNCDEEQILASMDSLMDRHYDMSGYRTEEQ